MKTADKYLQFGQDKCKAMVVGKRVETFHVPQLMVDTWDTSHTKDGRLVETFGGKKPIGNNDVLTYFGMEILKDGRTLCHQCLAIGAANQLSQLSGPRLVVMCRLRRG